MFTAIRKLFSKKPLLKSFSENWQIEAPKLMWLADSVSSAQQISLAEVETKIAATWTEVVLAKSSQRKKLIPYLATKNSDIPEISKETYITSLSTISENCIIRWLDNEVGWVVTLRPGKTIEQGFFTCYTGVLTSNNLKKQSSYLAREYFFSLHKTTKSDIGVDARHYGNVGRLLPFLLEAHHLENFQLDTSIQDKIAVANLQFKIASLDGVAMPCIFAPATITAPADQELLLGVNYSLEYLCKMQQENNTFKLINKNTLHQLDPKLYPLKFIQINLEGLNYSFPMSRFRILATSHFPQLKFRTKGFDAEKNTYYEITISYAEIYQAFLQAPNEMSINVKPHLTKL